MYPRNNTTVLLHLTLIEQLGPASIMRLLQYVCAKGSVTKAVPMVEDLFTDQYDGLFARVYDFTLTDIMRIARMIQADAQIVIDILKDTVLLDQELELIKQHAVTLLTPYDSLYPEALKHIHHPPVVLYVQGKMETLHPKYFAIVGARKANGYAQKIIDSLVPPLVEQGWTIVSGGALGADTMAHKATLLANGKTIAVLGSGLLEPYPEANIQLFKRIVESGGVVLSPFPLRRTPDKTTFPMRNRIIAGLSRGTLVVQAARRSGALITARFALEQGRSVLAIPGDINDDLSIGCHDLIKQGARLVTSADDIFEEFGETRQQLDLFVQAAPQDPLLATLQQPVTLDELLSKTNLGFEELQDRLFDLQVEGKVKQHFSGTWQQV